MCSKGLCQCWQNGCACMGLSCTVLGGRARGVDNATARRVLVYSFGGEVTAELPGADLRGRIQAAVNLTLAAVVPLAPEPASSQEAA